MPVVLHDGEHTGSTLIRRSWRWLLFFTSANVVHLSPVGTTEAQSKDLKSADLTSQIDLGKIEGNRPSMVPSRTRWNMAGLGWRLQQSSSERTERIHGSDATMMCFTRFTHLTEFAGWQFAKAQTQEVDVQSPEGSRRKSRWHPNQRHAQPHFNDQMALQSCRTAEFRNASRMA